MTNNLMRTELAEGQVNNQYATVNTADGRIDAALTEPFPVVISTLGTYTVTADDLTKHFEFVLTPHASPPVAPFAVVLDQDFPRGLVLVTNNTAQVASVTATGQTLPAVSIPVGFTSLIYMATADAILISAGAGGYVPISGGTMTGNLRLPVGNAASPSLQLGAADNGLFGTGGVSVRVAVAGVQVASFTGTALGLSVGTFNITAPIGVAASHSMTTDSTLQVIWQRSSADAIGGNVFFRKSRGTVAVPAAVVLNDVIGAYLWQAYSGAAYVSAGAINMTVVAAVPSATDMESLMKFIICPPGSAVNTEVMRISHATGIAMFGANIVIDLDRNFRLRSYTIATLPAHVAGKQVYCSDLGGGGSHLVSNGTSWLRPVDGFETSATAVDFSRTYLTNANILELTGALAADRVITLGAAPTGYTWEFISIGAHAFKHDVGGITNMRTNEWVRMVTDGTTWRVQERGFVKPPIALGFFYGGVPPVSTRLWQFVATEAFQLPDQYVGSKGWCQTAPGATIDFDVRKNNVSIGTITFTSANTATFVNAAAGVDQFAIGDRVSVHSPAALSALADLSITLTGFKQ